MNYIKSLEEANKEKEAKLFIIETLLIEFRAELQSSKFTGVDLDGERKDWISTSDVDSRLLHILSQLR